MAPPSAADNVIAAWKVRSLLRVSGLKAACQTLVDRHDVLRASCPERDGEPVQVVPPYREVSFEVTDVSG
jgi:hypothetical protein